MAAPTAETPLKWRNVHLPEVILHVKRLEAAVYDTELARALEMLKQGKYGTVAPGSGNGLILSAFYPGRFKRIYCEPPYGVEFYLPSTMTDLYPKPSKRIPKLTNCDIFELELKPSALLLTRSGTIGIVSCMSKTTEGLAFSDDVIRVEFKNDYDLGYVYIFLKSSIGRAMLKSNGCGAVITHLEPEHLNGVHVPNAPADIRRRINDLVSRSFALCDESNVAIDTATDLLVDALQLPSIETFAQNASVDTFSTKLSDMILWLDASYHVPTAKKIVSVIPQNAAEVFTLGDHRACDDIKLPGRFKRVYVDEGFGVPFFSGKNVRELDLSDKRYLSFAQHDDRIKDDLLIHEGMILVTCSGIIGHVVMVPKHWDGWAMTHDIVRYIPKDDLKGFAYIWSNSPYGNVLLNALAYGSVVQHVEISHFGKVAFPLLKDAAVQKRINDLALDASAKRYEAYRFEQEAIRIINDDVINA